MIYKYLGISFFKLLAFKLYVFKTTQANHKPLDVTLKALSAFGRITISQKSNLYHAQKTLMPSTAFLDSGQNLVLSLCLLTIGPLPRILVFNTPILTRRKPRLYIYIYLHTCKPILNLLCVIHFSPLC